MCKTLRTWQQNWMAGKNNMKNITIAKYKHEKIVILNIMKDKLN